MLLPLRNWSVASVARAVPALVADAALAGPLSSPATAAAQATTQAQLATPADLVGTWLHTSWVSDMGTLKWSQRIYTFRADGTANVRWRNDGGDEGTEQGVVGWYVLGDTLKLRVQTPPGYVGRPYAEHGRFVRDGAQLLWTRDPFTCADTLRHVDESKPVPAPVLSGRSRSTGPRWSVRGWECPGPVLSRVIR